MAIRIYALAKELKIDNKKLVDICTKAGIKGKGSALASLTEEELATLKTFMAGGRGGRAEGPVLARGPAGAAAPSGPAQAFRREDYLAPGGTLSGKVPVLGGKTEKAAVAKKKAAEDGAPAKPSEKERAGPAMKLAPVPSAVHPPAKAKSKEPAAQKPDIKLPADAIRATRSGSKPLSEHLRKHEEKKAKDEAAAKRAGPRKPTPGEGKPPFPPAETPAGGRERPRRGAAPPREEEKEEPAKTLGGREQRQLKRKRVAGTRRVGGEDEDTTATAPGRPRRTHIRRTGAKTAAPRKGKVVVTLPCTVRVFSESIGVPANAILAKLLALGTVSNIAANVDAETAELLAAELGVEAEFRREVSLEDKLLVGLQQETDDPARRQPRPPIVTFLGHVDHGKTSLLDRIIGIDVAAHEKGGITQHIRAYRVEKDGRAVTFVDTPGHEAFTEMRARGANVTDIAVLVVAADDGVMPQTEEAISHARAAGVPIVVALNKIDLPGINVDRIYQQLAVNELLAQPVGRGNGIGQDQRRHRRRHRRAAGDALDGGRAARLPGGPRVSGRGTCLESEVHEDRGVVAKFLVQAGTLRGGDVVVCGNGYGRIKAMYDTLDPHRRHELAGPSTPVNVTGLSVAPGAGDRFYVLEDISAARQLAESRAAANRQRELSGGRAARHPRNPLRAAGPAGPGADAEHDPAGRRPRLD